MFRLIIARVLVIVFGQLLTNYFIISLVPLLLYIEMV